MLEEGRAVRTTNKAYKKIPQGGWSIENGRSRAEHWVEHNFRSISLSSNRQPIQSDWDIKISARVIFLIIANWIFRFFIFRLQPPFVLRTHYTTLPSELDSAAHFHERWIVLSDRSDLLEATFMVSCPILPFLSLCARDCRISWRSSTKVSDGSAPGELLRDI